MLHSKISDQTVILIVKSSPAFYIPHFGMTAVVAAGLLLAGCGQPGPLYLPKLPSKVKPAATPGATPAPATPAAPGSSPVPGAPVTDDNAVQPSTVLPPVLPQ
jgi:predicted small lipoprotein YifL